MALFVMILRKMIKNKWLVFSLFIGIVISVALVSSMPIYSEAILSRMLVKELELRQEKQGIYPGTHYARMFYTKEAHDKRLQMYENVERHILQEASPRFGIPIHMQVADLQVRNMRIRTSEEANSGFKLTSLAKSMGIRAYQDLEAHIELVDGRLPALDPVDGVYEVMVTERGLSQLKTVLGKELTVVDDQHAEGIRLVIVGVFRKAQDDDAYFRSSDLSDLVNNFVMPYPTLLQHGLFEDKFPVAAVGWYSVFDYKAFELRKIDGFIQADKSISRTIVRNSSLLQLISESPMIDVLDTYNERSQQLGRLMWSLNVPIMIMLGFYMFMVSNLIAERSKTEIAVLRSRGAAKWQVIASYLVESLLLCLAAAAVGPLLGKLLTELLGATNGFLTFVQRVRLPVYLSQEAYQYGAITAAACLVIVLVPVILATRVTIVGHKQEMARLGKKPFWHKTFLDVLLLGLAIYGLFNFRKRMKDLQVLGLQVEDLSIDPLQFVIPALFIIGGGLVLLRLYPLVLRLLYWIGKRWWPPSLYATLIQVGRSSTQYQFLMIFLIMTIATGVFSASAARTINTNIADRIQYAHGADIVMRTQWINDAPPVLTGEGMPAVKQQGPVHYQEPPFEQLRNLPGVEQIARVFTKSKADIGVGNEYASAMLIGIDTDQFGMTTWFRDSLLDYPLNDYLNLIAEDPQGVLVSSSVIEQLKAKPGDMIWIGWADVPYQAFRIFGVIDYFPTFNPNTGDTSSNGKSKSVQPMLVVGNLPRIQVQLALEPYDVWVKLEEDALVSTFYEGLEESGVPVTSLTNTRAQLIEAGKDPFLLAINGVLTLGFVLSMVVSFIGFLLYWVLSLRGRTLQNGILRSIGLSLRQLITMLGVEQLLTSGIAVLIGIVVGHITSLLYVPNFQIAFNPAALVPPFHVRLEAADLVRIYVLVGIMLVVGLIILASMLSRLRIHQALKLGED